MLRHVAQPISTIFRDRRGNVGALFSLLIMPMFASIGAAVDIGQALYAKISLQAVVDAAAIAGARLPATANQNRYEAARHMLAARVEQSGLEHVGTQVEASNAEVRIAASYAHPTVLMKMFGYQSIDIEVASAARSQVENGGVACLLALNPSTSDGLHLQGINKSSAQNCWTWVNSDSSSAINATGAALATAQGFCAVGSAVGAEHFAPTPYTGCAPMDDPFADKFSSYYPGAESCAETDLELKNGSFTLAPGVYCGNTVLRPQANVTFLPGIYVIKGGYFEVQGGASVVGNGVTIFFRGPGTRLIVRGGGSIDLRAPASGDAAGFVLVDRKSVWNSSINETVIQGGGRVRLEGVVYAPQWRINISGNGDINQESRYFAMIADHFYMEGNGRLHIRSDAEAAGLPELMPRIKSGPVLTE